MPQGTTIYFVTFPDGKVDEASVNVFSKGHATAQCIRAWFPEHIFGKCRWLDASGWMVTQIWNDMLEKGFKVHAIDVPQKST